MHLLSYCELNIIDDFDLFYCTFLCNSEHIQVSSNGRNATQLSCVIPIPWEPNIDRKFNNFSKSPPCSVANSCGIPCVHLFPQKTELPIPFSDWGTPYTGLIQSHKSYWGTTEDTPLKHELCRNQSTRHIFPLRDPFLIA